MTDRQRQSNKGQADGIPEALVKEIRQLHLAMKRAILYPAGHPVSVKSAGEVCELLQLLLSSQESHSLTAIEDKLHISQHKMGADEQSYITRHIASDGIAMDLARRFRRRGIRSVVFSRGMELWELEKFLDIMTMRPKRVIAQGGACKLLRSARDVSHIEIVDIEYENIQVVADDGKEDSMDVEEILMSYLGGRSESLPDVAYTYLSSLLEEPDLMARLIEKCTGYDGVREPDSTTVIQCTDNLISLGERFTGEERKDFHRKLMEATLRMEHPVRNILYSVSDDDGILTRLMDGLSFDEIAVMVGCAADEPAVPLRKVFDELLISHQSPAPGSAIALENRLAEVEVAIQGELVERGREDVFNNTVIPLLEEVFVELEVGRLGGEQFELERQLDELYQPERRQEIEYSADEITDLFAAEDEVLNSALILLEMLESETDFENYSYITDQLEGVVKSLITGPQDKIDMRDQYLTMVFQIIDALSQQANPKNDKPDDAGKMPALPLELRERARKAILNIGTEEIIGQVISSSLRAEQLEWCLLERAIQQIGEKAIPPLIKNLLDVGNPPKRHRLGKILISMGPIVVPELRKWLSELQWVVVIKDIMPILSEIGGTEALDCLSDALNHPNAQVRRSAVSALTTSNNPGAAELILNKIRDDKEEESIRRLAISVLGKTGNEQVAEEIEKIIRGKTAALKPAAIRALGNIGGEKSISILSGLLKQKRLILGRRRIERLQLHAVEALSQIGTQSAIEVLLEMSRKKKGNVKSACDKALEGL